MKFTLETTIPQTLHLKRLDLALSALVPEHSRARLQKWIKAGFVKVNDKFLRAKDKVLSGQIIKINAVIENTSEDNPQAMPLNIIYQDEDILVLNKPVGLVIHPGAGQKDNTLLNGLLHQFPELHKIPRAGIVHRLDKNTSGLLVVARNLTAQTKLVKALQKHDITRIYTALVNGVMTAGGTIVAPIGRHKTKRTHMSVIGSGKPATTHYRVLKRFACHTLVELKLETGRTHQIRVHLAHINYPIVGDNVYGTRVRIPANCSKELRSALQNFKHQALHASCLILKHPVTRETLKFEAPLPEDMVMLLNSFEGKGD